MRDIEYEKMADEAIVEHQAAGFKRPRYEIPDPVPMSPPIGYHRAPSLIDQVRDMVRSEQLRHMAETTGAETFEESEDFNVEDYEPSSPWEEQFDPVERLREARIAELAIRAESERRDQESLQLLYQRYPNLRPADPQANREQRSTPSQAPKNKQAREPEPSTDD